MEFVMRMSKPAAYLGGMLALAAVGLLPAQAQNLVKAPVPLNPDTVAGIGDKKECISPDRMLLQLRSDEYANGGKTLAMVDGANQTFANMWRDLAGGRKAEVSLILAQGYHRPSGESVNIVEFDSSGCAFSETLISAADWNVIFGALKRGPAITV
jgi:hypothetical protein